MTMINYSYGCDKKKVKNILNDRLTLKKKIRHHKGKLEEMEYKLEELELEISRYIK